MNELTWRRHANPWSVWTRFAALPLMVAAIWSRAWLGWWAWAPVAVVVLWLWWNPHAFAPIDEPVAWSSRGIYGERLWLSDRSVMPAGFAVVQRIWVLGAIAGLGLLGWGLIVLQLWPTVFGTVLIVYGQLWRIDRLGVFYDAVSTVRASGRRGGSTLADDDVAVLRRDVVRIAAPGRRQCESEMLSEANRCGSAGGLRPVAGNRKGPVRKPGLSCCPAWCAILGLN